MMTGASAARADIITYTFTGAGGTLGTNWTLIDPNGYLTPPTGNVVGLLQTDTDLILDDPINGPEDFGPLTEIAFGTPPSEPSYYGMQMASNSFTLATLFIPQVDFTTPGTYEFADFVEVQNGLPADQGALTITATPTPEPSSVMLLGIGLGLVIPLRRAARFFT